MLPFVAPHLGSHLRRQVSPEEVFEQFSSWSLQPFRHGNDDEVATAKIKDGHGQPHPPSHTPQATKVDPGAPTGHPAVDVPPRFLAVEARASPRDSPPATAEDGLQARSTPDCPAATGATPFDAHTTVDAAPMPHWHHPMFHPSYRLRRQSRSAPGPSPPYCAPSPG